MLPAFHVLAYVGVLPGDPDWPSADEWKSLNKTVGGAPHRHRPDRHGLPQPQLQRGAMQFPEGQLELLARPVSWPLHLRVPW